MKTIQRHWSAKSSVFKNSSGWSFAEFILMSCTLGLRLAALLLLAFCALSSPLPAQSKSRHSAQHKGWELVWHDEFNGHALSDEWTRIPRFPNPSEWNKYMSTDDRLFRVSQGRLTLYGLTNDYLPQDTAHFLTGGVYTRGKRLFQRDG